MAYDFPYRLETHLKTTLSGHTFNSYEIVRTGVGIICTGEDHHEMRKVVDALNEMARIYAEEGSR